MRSVSGECMQGDSAGSNPRLQDCHLLQFFGNHPIFDRLPDKPTDFVPKEGQPIILF